MIRPLASGRAASVVLEDDDIEVRLATQPHELRGAFRLVYQSYRRAGLTPANDEAMRVTPYQLQESSEVIVAMKECDVIGTVSYIQDGYLGLPMEDVYGEEVDQLRARGIRLAEVSCLADRRSKVERSMPVLMTMMTLMAQSARHNGVDQLLIAVHPRHVRFYQRLMGFVQIGDTKQYGAVLDRPAIAMAIDLANLAEQNPKVYARFFGTPYITDALSRRLLRCPEFLREMLPLAAWQYEETHGRSGATPEPADPVRKARPECEVPPRLADHPLFTPWDFVRKLLTLEADSNELALALG